MRGGYQLLDLKNINFTSGTQKTDKRLSGLYSKIEGTRKPCVITNLVVGGTEIKDFEVLFTVSGSTYTGRHSYTANAAITIVVTDTDKVTVTIG